MAVLEVRNVKKVFGDNVILRGIDLDVQKGDVIVILGPSGSGKTTFLRCLNLLEKPDEGSMVLNGREYNLKNVKNKEKLEIRRNTSFVFQNYNLFVNKTVLSNVTLGLTVGRHMKKEEAEKTGKELLDKVGLAGKYDYYRHSYPAACSSVSELHGQWQRIQRSFFSMSRRPHLIRSWWERC